MKIKLLMFIIILVAAPALISLAQTTAANSTPEQDAATNAVAAPTNAVAAPSGSTPTQTNMTQTTTTQTTTTQTVPMPTVPMPLTTMEGTNTGPGEEVAEVLAFDDLPLPDAIRQLATLAGLNIQFDHKLDNPVDPVTHLPIAPPTVKEKWRNLTPMQALQALLDKYDWQMKKSPSTPVVIISAKEPNAVEPKVMEVILLGYSEPTNIVSEVQKAMPAVMVIADIRTHQVIVTTTEREMPAVKKLIARLDSATGQILIEAKIIETIKDINSRKGIDWTGTLQAQHLSAGNGLTGGTTTATTQSGNNLGAAGSTAPGGRTGSPFTSVANNSSSYVTTTVGNTAQAGGVTISTAGGFNPKTAFLNADGVSAILEFLNTDADTKSIALPRTVSLDGQKTTLAVIQNIPIFEQSQSAPGPGSSQGLATVLPNYEKKVGDTILNEVGFKLTVTPRIAGASNVLITVQPEISTVDTKIATSTLNGQVETSPIFDRRLITTEASVPSGYTLVLGGLDNDVIAKTYTKVPGLGDLPGIGSLFRSNTRDHTRDTILIFVTPTIIKDTDFQPANTDFLKSRNEPMPTAKDSAWDRGAPYDWTKPQSPVQPVYKP